MKRKELTATKAETKNLPAAKKKAAKKKGRGGARPGTGPKPRSYEFKQIHVDTPLQVLEAMETVKIENKTAFMIFAASKQLLSMNIPAKLKKELQKIVTSSNIHF